ncbi:MAG: phosphoglycerate mutase family protein [Patescibacteria group bacterium]
MSEEFKNLNPANANHLKVDFIRHGATEYLENTEKNKHNLETIPVDLTDVGIEQIEKVGAEVVNAIDPEKEVVILWSSPAWRAQGSEAIIEKLLMERGVTIFKKKVIRSMGAITQYGDKFDSTAEAKVRRNAENVFNWIRFIAERSSKLDKTIHIVGVTHYEFLNPLREDIFPFDVPHGKGFQKGENISFEFVFDKTTKELSITAILRNYEVKNIIFDKVTRKFISRGK